MASEAERIAKGLTKAQRVLLKLAATNNYAATLDSRPLYTGGFVACLKPYKDDLRCRAATFTITPLGLEVRAILEKEQSDDAS